MQGVDNSSATVRCTHEPYDVRALIELVLHASLYMSQMTKASSINMRARKHILLGHKCGVLLALQLMEKSKEKGEEDAPEETLLQCPSLSLSPFGSTR